MKKMRFFRIMFLVLILPVSLAFAGLKAVDELDQLYAPAPADKVAVHDTSADITYYLQLFRLAPLTYSADGSQADQGAASSNGRLTVKDFVDLIGTTNKATILLSNHGSGTTYTFSTAETIPSNIYLWVQPGAVISAGSGVTVTIGGSPENIIASPQQSVFVGSGVIVFTTGGLAYAPWFGTSLTVTNTPPNFTSGATQPTIATGMIFKTANASGTSISNFSGGVSGQRVIVILGDSYTGFDFTGSALYGNGGVDWDANANDWLECLKSGTSWYCTVHDCSS